MYWITQGYIKYVHALQYTIQYTSHTIQVKVQLNIIIFNGKSCQNNSIGWKVLESKSGGHHRHCASGKCMIVMYTMAV